jgi:hypothetical protein
MSASHVTEYYQLNRAARLQHLSDFLDHDVESVKLLEHLNELVAYLSLFISGKEPTASKNDFYMSSLIVSFSLSHFVIEELLKFGELVDVITLIRKQVELLARMAELQGGKSAEDLARKTPNVKHLVTPLSRAYGQHSEIAHSASTTVMELLGVLENEKGELWGTFNPVFTRHSLIAFEHLSLTVLEFVVWTTTHFHATYEEFSEDVIIPHLEKVIELNDRLFRDQRETT